MTEHLNVAPEDLRRAASDHHAAAERLRGVPAGHADIMASLDSLGPVFAELRDAGRDLLEQRRTCYEQQADAHSELADRLNAAADAWEQQDAEAAQQLRRIGDQ